jgi:hypothetical protein
MALIINAKGLRIDIQLGGSQKRAVVIAPWNTKVQ